MSGSNVWTRSRARMKLFPELLAQCSGEVHIHPVFLPQYCFVCVCLCVCVLCCVVLCCIILWIPPFVVVCTSVCFSMIILSGSCLWYMCGLHNHWQTGAGQKHVCQGIWSTEKLLSISCECFLEYFLTRIPFTQIYIREKKIYILLLHI